MEFSMKYTEEQQNLIDMISELVDYFEIPYIKNRYREFKVFNNEYNMVFFTNGNLDFIVVLGLELGTIKEIEVRIRNKNDVINDDVLTQIKCFIDSLTLIYSIDVNWGDVYKS
jgi:hypothetical protein